MPQNAWFAVDKTGLAKVLARRGVEFIVAELVANAWDEKVTRVDVSIEPVKGRRLVRLVVEDDSPDGFVDLSHAWTLFAESRKKGDPTVSGRFNLGDKLVFALAREAVVETTTGGVRFDDQGRHRLRSRRERGTKVAVTLPMTNEERDRCLALARRMIPRVPTWVNGEPLPPRTPIKSVRSCLETELADEDGFLRRCYRHTQVDIYEPLPGTKASLLELGVPVIETGDQYEYDVRQKIPLGIDREHVPPAYVNSVRVDVLGALAEHVSDPNADWVSAALERSDVKPEAVRAVVRKRFGEGAVAYDPSDTEAVGTATSKGVTVVHGGSLSAAAWENVRKAEALPRAGRVYPSQLPPGDIDKLIGPDEMTAGMKRVVRYARRLGLELLGVEPIVEIVRQAQGGYDAAWSTVLKRLTFNLSRLGEAWFGTGLFLEDRVVELILHEFGHEGPGCDNHLSHAYHENLCRLGAKMRNLGHLTYETQGE